MTFMKFLLMLGLLASMTLNSQTPREMTQIGLYHLGLSGVEVMIAPLSEEKILAEKSKGFVVQGSMSGSNGMYLMRLDMSLKTDEMIEVIAHELIHLRQIHSGKLLVRDNQVIYKMRYYKDATLIPHDLRVWEQDANAGGVKLAYKIKQKLQE